MFAHNAILIGIELFASSVWIGSLVCLAVVANAARCTLDKGDQVVFFRSLGRRYGVVGNIALGVAIAVGLVMLWPPSSWGRLEITVVVLAGLLIGATTLGIHQARSMTRLRRRSLERPEDPRLGARVESGARTAVIVRALIAATSLAMLSVVAVLLSG